MLKRHRLTTPLRIALVDYGMGNLRSISNAFGFLGCECIVSPDPEALADCNAFVLPGVGAFPEAMKNLQARRLDGILRERVLEDAAPFLGICLGMQLLASSSEELGDHRGLGWIDGRVVQLNPGGGLRVPHVGWNEVEVRRRTDAFENLDGRHCFYFDHSFHLECEPGIVSSTCDYDGAVVASVEFGNVMATQFHPEKSQVAGLKLLRGFVNYADQMLGATA